MFRAVLVAAIFFVCLSGAVAANITPDLSDIVLGPAAAPGVWFPDRYAPAGFTGLPNYMGATGVVLIDISSADGAANRPPVYSSSFYNTQGRKYNVTGGAGDWLQYSLWVPASWASASNGQRRTDFWATMRDAADATSAYLIYGFTNVGGPAFRVYDSNTGLWNSVASPVLYDSWNTLRVSFTGAAFKYSLNGSVVATQSNINGTTGFRDTSLQAYNFGETYDAHWSDVPEPAALSLVGAGLLGMALLRRRTV